MYPRRPSVRALFVERVRPSRRLNNDRDDLLFPLGRPCRPHSPHVMSHPSILSATVCNPALQRPVMAAGIPNSGTGFPVLTAAVIHTQSRDLPNLSSPGRGAKAGNRVAQVPKPHARHAFPVQGCAEHHPVLHLGERSARSRRATAGLGARRSGPAALAGRSTLLNPSG